MGNSAPAPRRAATMVQVSPDIVEAMRHLVVHRTDECLNARFGISYNSWRKIMAGGPIRASLAIRLEAKVRQLVRSELVDKSDRVAQLRRSDRMAANLQQ